MRGKPQDAPHSCRGLPGVDSPGADIRLQFRGRGQGQTKVRETGVLMGEHRRGRGLPSPLHRSQGSPRCRRLCLRPPWPLTGHPPVLTPRPSPPALALVPTKPPAPRSAREPGSLGPGLALPGRTLQAGSLGLSGVGGTTARLLPGKGGRAGERGEEGLGFLVCLDSKISRWRVRGLRAHTPLSAQAAAKPQVLG